MNGGEQLSSIVDQIREHANVETIYGEPVERDGKTVIPVAKIAYGFGGGYGSEGGSELGEDGHDGEGGGIGAGVKATPAGVVEITDYETRFIKFSDMKKIAAIAGLFLVFGYLLGRK